MKDVMTVCGPVPVDRLGKTLMHEHIIASAPGIADNYPELNENAMERMCRDLKQMKSLGIRTVVDATPFDLGRDAEAMKQASELTGVNIISCTGFFQEPDMGISGYSKEQIAAVLVREIREGIKKTGIRPGILKTAMDSEGPTPGRELAHRAVGIASRETGLPVMLHSFPEGEAGRHQIRFLREEGCDLHRVKVDHCLETTDIGYLSWLYEQGVWLGVDRLPRVNGSAEETAKYPDVETRIRTIRKMIDMGMADRMLFSHDFISVSTFWDHQPTPEGQAYVDGMCPERFGFLQQVVFPRLVELGADGDQLERMLEENPRRFFEGC